MDGNEMIKEVRVAEADTRLPLLIRAGRGNSGGTTALNATIEIAIQDGRMPVIVDAARNAGLATLYKDARRPASHAVKDVKAAFGALLDAMLEHGKGGVFDLGGGQDDTVVAIYRDLNLVEFGREANIRPVYMVTFGPDAGDFEHALEIKRRGIFDGADVLLVQSEGVLREGQDAEDTFGQIVHDQSYISWIEEGARPMYLKYLPPLSDIRKRGLSLHEAAADKPAKDGAKLGFTRSWQVRNWLAKWREQFERIGCDGWRV